AMAEKQGGRTTTRLGPIPPWAPRRRQRMPLPGTHSRQTEKSANRKTGLPSGGIPNCRGGSSVLGSKLGAGQLGTVRECPPELASDQRPPGSAYEIPSRSFATVRGHPGLPNGRHSQKHFVHQCPPMCIPIAVSFAVSFRGLTSRRDRS